MSDIAVETGGMRVARDVRDVDLDAYQRTVRRLFAEPLVLDDPEQLAAVRRWEPQLRDDLAAVGRYSLELAAAGARLVKRPLVLDVHRAAQTASKNPRTFDPRRYAYLCLALAALLTSGQQVLLSELGRRLADDASRTDGLGFDRDVHAHRTAFVDVVHWLEALGVLRLRDGSAAADLDVDALYDVDHEVVHLVVPSLGLRDLASIDDRFDDRYGDSRDERRLRARHRVLRRLLERPSLLYADLDDEERSWVQRNLARLAEDLARLTGLQLERRREGLALVDVVGDGSDRAFPGTGSPSQLALLLAERLATTPAPLPVPRPALAGVHAAIAAVVDGPRVTPQPAPCADDAAAETADHSPAWPREDLADFVAALCAAYPGVRRELRENVGEATRVAVVELLAFDLLRPTVDADGRAVFVAMPPIARFRPVAREREREQLDLFASAP